MINFVGSEELKWALSKKQNGKWRGGRNRKVLYVFYLPFPMLSIVRVIWIHSSFIPLFHVPIYYFQMFWSKSANIHNIYIYLYIHSSICPSIHSFINPMFTFWQSWDTVLISRCFLSNNMHGQKFSFLMTIFTTYKIQYNYLTKQGSKSTDTMSSKVLSKIFPGFLSLVSVLLSPTLDSNRDSWYVTICI
jgi:hypothetical protein